MFVLFDHQAESSAGGVGAYCSGIATDAARHFGRYLGGTDPDPARSCHRCQDATYENACRSAWLDRP